MNIDDYKSAMNSLSLDESQKARSLERISRVSDSAAARPKNSRLRLPAALAAALAAVFACAVTVAAVGTGFFGLKQFFENSVDRSGADITMIGDAEEYGSEGRITASSENISASIVSTACDGHYIVAIVEVDASDCKIPEEAVPMFRRYSDNFHGGTVGMTLLSRSESLFTYGYYNLGFAEIPDSGGEITLGSFGCYSDGGYSDFVTLSGEDMVFEIKKDSLNILESVRSTESAEIEGITVGLEISPLGILLSLSDDPTSVLGIDRGDDFSNLYKLMVNMADGSVQGLDSGFLRSENGWIDRETGGYCIYVGFTAPIDLSTIKSVSFHGVEFEFDMEVNNE